MRAASSINIFTDYDEDDDWGFDIIVWLRAK